MPALFPHQYGLGPKVNIKWQTRSEAIVREFERYRSTFFRLGRLPVGVPGVSVNAGFSAIPLGKSFKRLGLNEVDGIIIWNLLHWSFRMTQATSTQSTMDQTLHQVD